VFICRKPVNRMSNCFPVFGGNVPHLLRFFVDVAAKEKVQEGTGDLKVLRLANHYMEVLN